jgi:hypothetical protein
MAVASTVKKLLYLAREVSPGTEAPPSKYLQGLNIRLVGNNTRGEVRPSGSLLRTDTPEIQDWSTFSIAAGSSLDFNSLLYILAGVVSLPTTTTPDGATEAREHAFTFLPDGSAARAAYTMITGYRGGTAEKALRNVFAAFGFGYSRTAVPTISGSGYGRNLDFGASLGVNEVTTVTITGSPDGGTFTITVNGQPTSGIAYNAIASAVQTALEGLSNVAPGDVAVTGSAGGPYTLAWGGALANTDPTVSADGASLTGGTAPAASATEAQKGGITTVPVKSIQAPMWSTYVDDTAAAIGTTKVRHYNAEFALGGLTEPDWVVDADLDSYDDDVVQVPDLTFNLTGRNDATFRALRADLKAGATKFVRAEAVGPEIEDGQNYLFRVDMAVKANANLGQLGDDGGRETLPLPLRIVSDSTFASGGFSALLRNALTDL